MSNPMRQIAIKSAIAALLSLGATLSAAKMATIYLGGSLAGTGLLLSILCPLLIAGPASAWQFYQQFRLETAHDELEAAKTELDKAHADLQQAYRQLDERARHDGLTGILNREGFASRLDDASAREDGTLFICDVDQFKRINDRHGHPIGDEALRSLVMAIKTCLDDSDIFGRIGGEEFAIFKPRVHGAAAVEAAERMLLAVRTTPVAARSGQSIPLTVSIGGADSQDFDDLDAAWRAADARLYAAKAGGRDRCVLDSTGTSAQLHLFSALLNDASISNKPIRLARAGM